MKIPFSPPYIDDSIVEEVTQTLRSGWITTGPKVSELEQEIARLTAYQKVLCVNSWTSGAILILNMLGIKPGDEVIIPAYTYCATAFAVLHAGGTPVMVDVDEDFNMDMSKVEAAITPRTKAIIPVDVGGYPCRYRELKEIVTSERIIKKFVPTSDFQNRLGRILILADAAHSMGAHVKPIADVCVFSLHAVKNITSAEGGAVCLNLPDPFDNNDLYAVLRCTTLNCQTKDSFTKETTGSWRYDITGLGFKFNLADINAAVAMAQLRKLPALQALRKAHFDRYHDSFSKYPWAINPKHISEDGESSYHLYMLRIADITEERRDKMMQIIMDEGVAVNVHFQPLPMLTYFKEKGYVMDNYPQSWCHYKHEISLPLYPQLTSQQIDFVVQCVVKAYNETSF